MTRRPRRRIPTRPAAARPAAEPLEGRALFAAAPTPAPVAFAPPTSAATGKFPAALAVADLNGDGRPDVVTADYGDDTVAVLINAGGGTFAAPVLYPVPVPPQSVAVGDFNGDGRPDVVVVGDAANLAFVLTNRGDGTLAAAVPFAVGAEPQSVVVADVNGDGRPDIVTADFAGNSVSVLMNEPDGAGGFTFAPAVASPAGPGPTSIAAGDFNGDGHPDLVVANPDDQTIHVLLNLGDGTFPLVPTAYATSLTSRAVAVADVNDDARPDVLVTDLASATVSVLPGVGDGTFRGAVVRRTGGFPFAATAADLTGDNRADLVTADNRDDAVGVLVHDLAGSFNHWRSFPVGTPGSSSPEAVAVADVDGDGRPDVISADFNDSSIGILLNRTPFAPLTNTTLALTPSQNPVQAGNPLTLTATVLTGPPTLSITGTPSPRPLVGGGGRVVQFVVGSKVIGFVKLTAAGTATLTTAKLPVGTTSVLARFPGNGVYAPSSATVDQTVLTPAASTPRVAATAVRLTGRAGVGGVPFLPGDAGTAAVTITAVGPGRATGRAGVTLSAYPVGDPAAAVTLATARNAGFVVNLRGGLGTTVALPFTLPADLAAGQYTIAAALTPAASTFAGDQLDATPAATAAASSVVLGFGAIGVHRNYALTRTLGTGAVVRVSLAGPGTGVFADIGNGQVVLNLSPLVTHGAATGGGSVLTVTPVSGAVAIAALTDPAPIGTVAAAGVPVVGQPSPTTGGPGSVNVNLAAGVRRLTVGDVADSQFAIGPVYRSVDAFGAVRNSVVFSSAVVQSVAVGSWAGGSLTLADVTQSITSGGDFDATLAVAADVTRLSIGGTLSGVAVAGVRFGEIAVGGNLVNATVLAGVTLGTDGALGGGNDTFNVGRIASVQVGGSVVGSVVAAGLRPAADAPFTPVGATLLRGGAIGKVVVGGPVDAASAFLAASVPPVG